jgi:hypothetical protein
MARDGRVGYVAVTRAVDLLLIGVPQTASKKSSLASRKGDSHSRTPEAPLTVAGIFWLRRRRERWNKYRVVAGTVLSSFVCRPLTHKRMLFAPVPLHRALGIRDKTKSGARFS